MLLKQSGLELKAMTGSDRAWTYATADWSENEAFVTQQEPGGAEGEEIEGGARTELLAFRFKGKEEALLFKECFENACSASTEQAGTLGDPILAPVEAANGDATIAPASTSAAPSPAISPARFAGDHGGEIGGRYGALVLRQGFWEEEGGCGNLADAAPLLRRNAGFIVDPLAAQGVLGDSKRVCETAERMNEGLLQRALTWVSMCRGAEHWLNVLEAGGRGPVMADLAEGRRILEADAERTFKNPLLRVDMVALLAQVANGDYHQGLGYLAAFLRLLLPETHVLAIVWSLSLGDSDFYVAGYWKGIRQGLCLRLSVRVRLSCTALFVCVGASVHFCR